MIAGPVSIHEDPELAHQLAIAEVLEDPNATQWIEPSSENHWLSLRAENINSTESAALFGLSPYSTKFELWHRKKDIIGDSFEENERTKWGRRLQDAIAFGVGEERGWKVTPLKEYAFAPKLRMGSSFDFQAYCAKRGTGILEIKNVDYSVYKREWLDDEAPDHIEIQLQHQLEVSRLPWGCIAALVGGNTLKLIIRERDKDMGAAIRTEIEDFWRSVDEGNPPDPNFADDAETINRLYSKSGGGTISLDDARLEYLAKQYVIAGEDERAAAALKEATAAEIKLLIGAADAVFCGPYKIGAKAVADNPGKVITPDMVGQVINARKGYRPIRITEVREKR